MSASAGAPAPASTGVPTSAPAPAPAPTRTALWCVLQTTPGHEAAIAARVARLAGDALTDSFALRRQALRRRDGAWSVCDEVMFPGYVFLVVRDAALLERRLDLLTGFGRLLRNDDQLYTLDPDEVAFVEQFGGPDHIVRLSRGDIVDGTLLVREGPLQGRTSLIAKIDRHKRIARLSVGVLTMRSAVVGLEVMSKT